MSAVKPWGRFKLVSKEPASDSDHLYFVQSVNRIGRNPARCNILLDMLFISGISVNRIGRNPARCNILLDMLFISGIHCVVTLKGKNERGEPIVMLEDLSRNGIYLNEELLGKGKSAELLGKGKSAVLPPNITIHFTKPGLQSKAVQPTVFKFELLCVPGSEVAEIPKCDRLASSASRPSSVSGASITTSSNASVAPTQAAARVLKRSHAEQEVEIEHTRSLSAAGERTPPSAAKRRRTGDAARTNEDDLLETTAQIQKANQSLRLKLKEAAEREAKLKQALSEAERQNVSHLEKIEVFEETNKSLEEELGHQKMTLAERDEELDRVRQAAAAVDEELKDLRHEELDRVRQAAAAVDEELKDLRRQLEAADAEISSHTTEIVDLKQERQKIDAEMASMTRQYEAAQARIRSAEEQVRTLINEKKKLELAVDSVQTRNEQAEEGKRGVHEENIVLKTRLTSAQQVLREMQKLVARGFRVVEDETAVMSQELEDLRRQSDTSFFSSEQSQPTPVQDHFCADTQTDDLEDDQAQTLDQDAALTKAAQLPTSATTGFGPFTRATPTLPVLPQSISVDLLESEQQPVSTDMSVDETPLYSENKSLSEGSSASSTSKTPPARPLPREPLVPTVGADHDDADKEVEAQESKEAGEENAVGGEDEDEDEEEEEEEEEAKVVENDNDNTPVMPAAAEASTDAGPQDGKEKGWLQRIVADEGDGSGNSEHASASEGGGMFDDETQLSAGEH
ncbi:hypothetical protein P43SY_002199 [Pythium insidiosum]|uniref:FHA domain-containing protein n=1 Tax=Pythium insidiosum TaxID=114742 RepID=A0AAD5QAH3_PYTIN|nr:hypothetical protein P43SY_002199 [Pythium insidiosum]